MHTKLSTFQTRLWLATGAFYGMIAVILSSLTSHLPDHFFVGNGRDIARIADYILFIHGLILIAISILQKIWQPSLHLNIIGYAFNIGVCLFAGAVFYTAFTGEHPFIPLAPIGGVTLICAWFYLIVSSFLLKDRQ